MTSRHHLIFSAVLRSRSNRDARRLACHQHHQPPTHSAYQPSHMNQSSSQPSMRYASSPLAITDALRASISSFNSASSWLHSASWSLICAS